MLIGSILRTIGIIIQNTANQPNALHVVQVRRCEDFALTAATKRRA